MRVIGGSLVVLSGFACACGGDSSGNDVTDSADDERIGDDADAPDAAPCPDDMVLWEGACIDRHEAPNRAGDLPLVMYTFVDADAWCASRGKRLCFDDEWLAACEGPDADPFPYGPTLVPGECNDDETWRTYDQDLLNGWPSSGASSPDVESFADLLAAARAVSTTAAAAADHVESLYQGEPAGSNAGCVGAAGVFDLVGNVEEWTRRRDGGSGPEFHGALKGRYWAESRTCQSAVTAHGDGFRFYEIGFRCCRDPE